MEKIVVARFDQESEEDDDSVDWGRRRCHRLYVLGGILSTILILGATAAFITWQVHLDVPAIPIVNDVIFEHGAVTCDSPYCAEIGRETLKRGGSVTDSAIATLLCMGVVHSQSSGIGGGFMMVLYNSTTKQSTVLNARETAPSNATRDMFEGDPDKAKYGGLAVAIPGEIAGYWKMHQTSGKLPWKELFQPTIELCETGFKISKHTANAFNYRPDLLLKEPSLTEIFVNPHSGKLYEEGETITRKDLIGTLKRIAEGGKDEFYEGEVGKSFVEDLQKFGGIITMDDMKAYEAEWQAPLQVKVYGDYTLHAVPPPGCGVLLAFIMKVLGKYQFHHDAFSEGDEEAIRVYQIIVETFKHAFAKRTELGDPLVEEGRDVYDVMSKMISDEFVAEVVRKIVTNSTNNTVEYYGAEYYQPDDHGTAHVSIIGSNGDAVSITSTVNLYFGAMIRSKRTGIIFNDQMDDFSAPNITNYFGVPPSRNNFIQPGKRPLSSMTPSIFTDSMGRVRLVIGSAGGTKISTATALVSMKNLWFGENIKDAIDARRIHHQLYPMEVQYERDFPAVIVDGLKRIGHNVTEVGLGNSVTVAVSRECDGRIHAYCDFRKPGSVAGF